MVVDVLGCGSGYPTASRDTTGFLVGTPDGWSVVDCPGSLVHKLAQRGLQPSDLRRVIFTHNHVDHVYGFPHLIHALAIEGVVDSVEVAGPAQTLATLQAMVAAHGLDGERYPRLREVEVPLEEEAEIAATCGVRIRFSPALHSRDTVAVRIDAGAASMCYSADTQPSRSVARLARGAGILLHDCGGPHRLRRVFAGSHSSAQEAARTAAEAETGRLVLVHLGVSEATLIEECVVEAQASFSGAVSAAYDGACWRLPTECT